MTLAARLHAWWRGGTQAAAERLVVVDTETSGLDPERAALLAIGAVAVDAAGIRLDDSFEVVVRNEAPVDRSNVVVHGIGQQAQRGGVPLADAMRAFLAYLGGAPCVAFHADFDRAVLARAVTATGEGRMPPRWLDLAPLAAVLDPQHERKGARSLDDWLAVFGIAVARRHSAAGDALATAQLLLRLRVLAARQGAQGFAALVRITQQGRWLGGGR